MKNEDGHLDWLEGEGAFCSRKVVSLEVRQIRHKKREELFLDGTSFGDQKGSISAVTPPTWEPQIQRYHTESRLLGAEEVTISHLSAFLSSKPDREIET